MINSLVQDFTVGAGSSASLALDWGGGSGLLIVQVSLSPAGVPDWSTIFTWNGITLHGFPILGPGTSGRAIPFTLPAGEIQIAAADASGTDALNVSVVLQGMTYNAFIA